MLLEIRPALGNTRGPLYMESLLKTIHRSCNGVSLQMMSLNGEVGLSVDLPDEVRALFIQELQDVYPGTTVKPVRHLQDDNRITWTTQLHLSPDVFNLRTHEQFLDVADDRQFGDPVAGVMSAIRTGNSGRFQCKVQLLIRSASRHRIRDTERIMDRSKAGFRRLSSLHWYLYLATSRYLIWRLLEWLFLHCWRRGKHRLDVTTDKTKEQLFECLILIQVTAPVEAKEVALRKLREIAGTFGRFTDGEARFLSTTPTTRSRVNLKRGFLLSAKEIATLWHPLTESGDTVSRMQRPLFREVEPPVSLASRKGMADETMLGRVKFRQQQNQFGIGTDDLRRHLIVVGKTGCGKSTFLRNVVRQQMEANRGVILIDPHGQLADEVLDTVPKRRTNDVILFEAGDRNAPVGFNPLIGPKGTDASLIADGVLTSFKNVFGFDAGSAPRLLHIFRNCLLSVIGSKHASLSNVQRILVDANFRKSIIAQVQNEAVRGFWLTEFQKWHERERTQYIASLQNKLGAFTTNQQLHCILNAKEGIKLREVMDNGQILICNLSKGIIGHDASTLLGSLFLSSLHIAAMSRANVAEHERTDCVVVVDEFHSYLSEGNSTMADALAESRKYRTSYVLSTQMLDGQLDPGTLAGVLGNCGSTLCMTVGPKDATLLAELLGAGLTSEDLMKIPKYHAYLRMLINGAPHTFSMTTLPPPRYPPKRGGVIRKVSRQKYAHALMG